jgi:hypothetical protein
MKIRIGSMVALCTLTGVLALSGCGSTSDIRDSSGQVVESSSARFAKVRVMDFKNAAKPGDAGADAAAVTFPGLIASEIRKTGRFRNVARNGDSDPDTLTITGEVTRYEEGNAALRFFIGMGAGSSYFDASVHALDDDGKGLGDIVVDRNSWGLGGGMAAGQNPQTFMRAAAGKIAEEVVAFAP